MILMVVSCTGDNEHPYSTYADDLGYAEEEYAEEALPPAEY